MCGDSTISKLITANNQRLTSRHNGTHCASMKLKPKINYRDAGYTTLKIIKNYLKRCPPMAKYSRGFKLDIIRALGALSVVLGAATVHAATYYVATTGNDGNPGTSGSPFLTIQRCVDTVAAGDTCLVADGTYRDNIGNGTVVYISSASAAGSASKPITVKSVNKFGAIIILPGRDSINAGFYISQPYYIIEGFEITGGTSSGTSVSHHGVYLTSSATGTVVRDTKIHDIGRTVCSNSAFGFDGIFTSASSVSIENNILYSIGRLKNGENGCSTSITVHDHGVYIKGGSDLIIRRNVIYDTNRGWPLHFYGGTVTNVSVFHNVFAGHNTSTSIPGHILLAGTITNLAIRNNISYDATVGMVQYYGLTASGVSVTHNLSDTLEKTANYLGVTFSSNMQNTKPGFADAAGNNFQLVAGSAAIDAGTSVGLPFSGAAPDIGAYEFGGDSASPRPPQNLTIRQG